MPTDIEQTLDRMSIEEKVGQMFCFGFSGVYPHQDILEAIERYHPAGFRVTPTARKMKRYLPDGHPGIARVERPPEPLERLYGSSCLAWQVRAETYAAVLNTLRDHARKTGAGVPLYFSLDFEGGGSMDLVDDRVYGVPHPMGLAASDNEDLAYEAAAFVARQLTAVGVNALHSPCLDVNTCPANPEIGPRSFSPQPAICSRFGLAMMKGYARNGLMPVAKHFPGRGHSSVDAHYEVAVIKESPERMHKVHIEPYKALIEAGLPMIMLAHTAYPSLDPSGEIATLSKPIVSGLLREQMGFKRVIMTDSFTMGGLVGKYPVDEAVVLAIEAGVDLILLKDENRLRGEAVEAVLKAVRSNRLAEDRVHASARRVLEAKAEYKLLTGTCGQVDPSATRKQLDDPANRRIAKKINRETICILRNSGLVPLQRSARILVVEQCSSTQRISNNESLHVGTLYEALLERGAQVFYCNYDGGALDAAWPHIEHLLKQTDILVHTGYAFRGSRTRTEEFRRLNRAKPDAVFVCNSPYPHAVPPEISNVVVRFSEGKPCDEAVADILLGLADATASLAFDPEATY